MPELVAPLSTACRAPASAGRLVLPGMVVLLAWAALSSQAAAAAPAAPTSQQRGMAERVAASGVPLSELAPDAPSEHEVKPGDTLWGLAGLFLKSPWRWPELWGMNLEQVRNPHLLLPGQRLSLLKADGRARLVVGTRSAGPAPAAGPAGTAAGAAPAETPPPVVKMSPQVRATPLPPEPAATLPLKSLSPFLNETIVVDPRELEGAPRIAASTDGRLMMSRGDIAYVEGELGAVAQWRIYRAPVPLVDPQTGEVLGYEARHVGSASVLRLPVGPADASGRVAPAPVALRLNQLRLEARAGDRLLPAAPVAWPAFVPRAPASALQAQVLSIADEGMSASQRQVVAVNRGARDGLETGHVLALWRSAQPAGLPPERHGLVMVVRTFERVSYALVLDTKDPVRVGDRLTQP